MLRKIEFSEIKNIVNGVAYLEEAEGRIVFHRFTKEQETLYENMRPEYISACMRTAGVKLLFQTDSSKLYLKADTTSQLADRMFYSFDVSINGKQVDKLDNFSGKHWDSDYVHAQFPTGVVEKCFEIGQGDKTVCIEFPYTVRAELIELCVEEHAYVKKIKRDKKLLAFGDSITHGYDALHPSKRYISRLAEYLEAEEVNKAIGGETFFPELGLTKEEFEPEYITVAYGTNDWSHNSRETFVTSCTAFYKNISETYPKAKIYAISPIWRKDYQLDKEFGPFHELIEVMQEAVADLSNVKLIQGFDLVPHDEKLFGDFRLHPNDEGFTYYFENCIRLF